MPGLVHGLDEWAERPGSPRPDTWAAAGAGPACRDDPQVPGQLYPVYPTPQTAAPNTWPTGSKPALRIAANSPDVSADPHVPPDRTAAIVLLAVNW